MKGLEMKDHVCAMAFPDPVPIAVVRSIARAEDTLEALRLATQDDRPIGEVVWALAREVWWRRDPVNLVRGAAAEDTAADRGLYRGHP